MVVVFKTTCPRVRKGFWHFPNSTAVEKRVRGLSLETNSFWLPDFHWAPGFPLHPSSEANGRIIACKKFLICVQDSGLFASSGSVD